MKDTLTLAGETGATFVSRLNSTDLSKCPDDFQKAYVRYRLSISQTLKAYDDLSKNTAAESDAQGASVAVGAFELFSGHSTGITAYSDWKNANEAAKTAYTTASAETADAYKALQIEAAGSGVTFKQSDAATNDAGTNEATTSDSSTNQTP